MPNNNSMEEYKILYNMACNEMDAMRDEHSALQAKHDELVKLAKKHMEAEIDLRWYMMPCDESDSLWREKRLKYLKAQAALRKAVGREGVRWI